MKMIKAHSPMRRDGRAGRRILGVDPGTLAVGFGVLEMGAGGRPRVIAHGVVRAHRGLTVAVRLREIYLALERLIVEVQPDVVVVEEVFYGKNFQSALRIGEGRGVVLLAAALAGRAVVEYPPATVKQAVTGNGRATKDQVQRMVSRLLSLDGALESTDAADALALALCHAQRAGRGLAPGARAVPRPKRRLRAKSLQALLDRIDPVSDRACRPSRGARSRREPGKEPG